MRLAYAFGETAIKRERRNRHDKRGHFHPRDDKAIDEPRERAHEEREDDRQRQRKAERLPRIAEHDRAQADNRADRKVDAAGDDDEGHRQRDKADLGHEPALVEKVVQGEKAVVQQTEAEERDQENDREQCLVTLEPAGHAKRLRFDRQAHRFHPCAARRWRRRMSAMTVARMSPPRNASVQ